MTPRPGMAHRWAMAGAWCALAACTERPILVTVELDGGGTQCVRVAASPDETGGELTSLPIPVTPGEGSLAVAVFRGTLAQHSSVLARGYDTPDCDRLNEESKTGALNFDTRAAVTLHLNGTPCVSGISGNQCAGGLCRVDGACVDASNEVDCRDAVDNNAENGSDCQDPTCLGQSCSTNLCVASSVCLGDGGCGTTPVVCSQTFNECQASAGTCNPANGGCGFSTLFDAGCGAASLCIVAGTGRCQDDAGCAGPPKACGPPPNTCYDAGTCNPADGGCVYLVNLANLCLDGNRCTTGDTCQADGTCAGTPQTGTACDAGYCNVGNCVNFNYAPTNFSPNAIAAATIGGDVALSCDATWNTTDGGNTWCLGQPLPTATVITQDGGVEAVVLAMRSLFLDAGVSLTVTGDKPLILAVWGDATIRGTINVASTRTGTVGAGANVAGCVGANGQSDTSGTVGGGGGGGGGFGQNAGNGGDATGANNANGGNGTGPVGNPTLDPLRGGCRGGAGGRPQDPGSIMGIGGPSGGAVQISAAGTLTVSGAITASGAGGTGGLGAGSGTTNNGGGGGGSGGGILLEGANVNLNGSAITANGGGGAEGSDNNANNNGDFGNDGSPTAGTNAAGGTGNTNGGAGGRGGAAAGAPVAGSNATDSGGGGGGGVGRIRVRSQGTCTATGGTRSPVANANAPNCPATIP